MSPTIYSALCLVSLSCVVLALSKPATENLQLQQQADESVKQNVSDEMHLITKSLEDLLLELGQIKREAVGRLSSVKNRASPTNDQERIRQTKVSRFVLNRVAELESESLSMREEFAKLFNIQRMTAANNRQPSAAQMAPLYMAAISAANKGEPKQEDLDFDEPTTTTQAGGQTSSPGMPSTTTMKPDEEAAKIGFDMEALKKLGANLESEIEARQQQTPESLRGVHEQAIKLIDNMVQNYLGNVRRTIQRMTNFIDNQRSALTSGGKPRNQVGASPTSLLAASPPGVNDVESESVITGQFVEGFSNIRQSILNRIQSVSKNMHDFTMQWTRAIGKQQSPLIDRIPPRGVELWRDFWDTVRKQVRRINQEFWQLSQDMSRMITGRLPSSSGPRPADGLPPAPRLFYSAESKLPIVEQFQQFYDNMSATLAEAQQKMESIHGVAQSQAAVELSSSSSNNNNNEQNNLIDENDDEMTKNELNRNVALRQQIQQEINIFSSIFDIMRTFIQRLRESATNMVRDVVQPSGSNNNNDPVTPGPSVKPQVDKLLDETIESQRVINGQAKPVLMVNKRPVVAPSGR